MPRSSTTANAILGMLALRREWPVYELTKQVRRNMRFFWPRAESRIYAEAKRLVERGHAKAVTTYVGQRPRTTYSITPAGRKAVSDWLAAAPRPTSLDCEPLLRVFLADQSTPEDVKAALDQVRDDAAAILEVGALVGAEYIDGTAPFQDQLHVRGFVFDFLSSHALMLRDWADRTEASFAKWPELSQEARTAAGLALVEDNLSRYPAGVEPRDG